MREKLIFHPALELFLRSYNCYEEFIDNVLDITSKEKIHTTSWDKNGIFEGCRLYNPSIIDCFIWDDSPEGHDYWESRYTDCSRKRDLFVAACAVKNLKVI